MADVVSSNMGAGPGDDEKGEEQVAPWAKDLEAARIALQRARTPHGLRQLGPEGSLGSTQVAYEMELAEHRSTLELDKHPEHAWVALSGLEQLVGGRQPWDDIVKRVVERGLRAAAEAGL